MSNERRFYEAAEGGAIRSAPAALRNRGPIGAILEQWLPQRGLVLEIASGTGEHVDYFAELFPHLDWQPSDVHPDALASIAARVAQAQRPNLRQPVTLDASSGDWPLEHADALLSINMVHISAWSSALGLIDGAAKLLPEGAPLLLYGPWISDDLETAESNLAFDADLKRRDPEWGLRRVEDFAEAAAARGLGLADRTPMPANNMMLLFRKQGAAR